MSKFNEVKKTKFLETLQNRMDSVKSTNASLLRAVQDAKANWDGYAAIEDDAAALEATFISYAAAIAEMWEEAKAELAEAMTILANGMLDGEGQRKTLTGVLSEIAAVELG